MSAFGYFLWLMWTVRDKVDQTFSTQEFNRPSVWKLAISEWAVYFSIILWILVLSLGIG